MTSNNPEDSTSTTDTASIDDGLKPGRVSEEQFDLLMQGTSIRGENVILALHDHLVNGLSPSAAWVKHNVNKSQFIRRLSVLFAESNRARKLSKFYSKG